MNGIKLGVLAVLACVCLCAYPVYADSSSTQDAASQTADESAKEKLDPVAEAWEKQSLKPHDIKAVEEASQAPAISKPEDPKDTKQLYALASTYESGTGGQQKDLREAARLYKLAAEKGYAPAQYKIGLMNEEGDGVLRNPREAERWYQKAADQDYTLAQTNLARMYYEGTKLPQNYKAAAVLSQLAADRDDAEAQVLLAKMYHYGYGVPQDYKAAAYWYSKSARLGSPSGQYRLAVMFVSGQGIKRDLVQAFAWANVAAAQGVDEAEELREEIARKLPQGNLEKAQNLSRQYYKRYAEPF